MKPNYDFAKHRRELDRKAAKDEKLRRRREKAMDQRERAKSPEPSGTEPSDTRSDDSVSPAG